MGTHQVTMDASLVAARLAAISVVAAELASL